jgi:hypothetical protein
VRHGPRQRPVRRRPRREFLLEDLILGRYTVKEVAPFPPGFEPDPDTVTVDLTLEPDAKDATIAEAFVNRALFRLIVLTCNTSTETLVDSTVDLSGDVREAIAAGQLPAGVTEGALCTLPGGQPRQPHPEHLRPEHGAARRTTGVPGTMTGSR